MFKTFVLLFVMLYVAVENDTLLLLSMFKLLLIFVTLFVILTLLLASILNTLLNVISELASMLNKFVVTLKLLLASIFNDIVDELSIKILLLLPSCTLLFALIIMPAVAPASMVRAP